MNPRIAFLLTLLAALCIPAVLVIVPSAHTAGIAAGALVGIGIVWLRALENSWRDRLDQVISQLDELDRFIGSAD